MKQKLEFNAWFEQVRQHAGTKGYVLNGAMLAWERAYWQRLYDKGLRPQQAWDYELQGS